MYKPLKGGTILGEISGRSKHLIIICNDPVFYNEETPGFEAVLTVNVTTCYGKDWEDDSCILNQGDHSFIKHKSFVYYKQAMPVMVEPLIKKVIDNEFIPLENVDESVLNRILLGFEKSKFVPRKALRFYNRYVKNMN